MRNITTSRFIIRVCTENWGDTLNEEEPKGPAATAAPASTTATAPKAG